MTRCQAWQFAGAILLSLAALCSAPSAFAQDTGLIIETGSPDALCPELASTRAAVHRRLGGISVPGGSSGFRARYTIGHAPVGSPRDFVRLELFGPEGTLQLSRDLPLEGESCSTMSEVIALVLDRYFSALRANEPFEDPATEPSANGGQAAPAGPVGPEAAPAPSAPSSAALAPVEPSSMPLDAGPERLHLVALDVAWRSPAQPAVGVRGMLELWPAIYLGTAVHVGIMQEEEDLEGGGRVSSRDATWRAYAGWGPEIGPVRTYIGPGLYVGLSRGAGPELDERTVRYRVFWGAGLDLGAVWVMKDGWSLAASGALDVSISARSGQFVFSGEEVLEPDPVRAWFGVSVGHAF